MSLSNEYWGPVFKSFKEQYPDLVDLVIDWYPVRQFEIIVKLKNDEKYIYHLVWQTAKHIRSENAYLASDEIDFRKLFSERLNKKMLASGLSQLGLAEATDISNVTISNYITCKATPSAFNLVKICDALKCTPDELMYFIQ